MASLDFANWRGARIYLDPAEELAPELEAALKKKLSYSFVSERALLFGSPDDVVEKLWQLHRETNIEQVLFKCSFPGLAHEHTMRCLNLIASEVIPRFRARVAASAASRSPLHA